MKGTETVIFSWTYRYRDREFAVWSYLSTSDPESSSLLFAFRAEGETVEGLASREEAVRKARQRIDERTPEPGEATPATGAQQTIHGHPPQQAELALV